MHSIAVAPFNTHHNIRYSTRSIVLSLLFMFNVAVMPLKAYFSEPFPWTQRATVIPPNCTANYTQCAQLLLSFFQNQSNYFEPKQRSLSSEAFDLFKIPFPLLPENIDDASTYALQMPYSVFYTKHEIGQAMAIATRRIKVSDFSNSQIVNFFGMTNNYNILWAEEGKTENTMFIGIALVPSTFEWLLLKFLYRLSLSTYIVWYMWTRYYRHYALLATNICQFGFKDAPKPCKFEIIVGDPTSIVLLNPVVSMLFVIDFWISVDCVGRCFVRILQVGGIREFLLAYLYLSRTLWFGYGSLSLVSYFLKKFKRERYFHGVDPSWTAIAVSIVSGPFTLLQSRIPLMVQFYNLLFNCAVNHEHVLESSLASALYTILVGSLPVVYGFMPKSALRNFLARISSRKPPPGSYLNNDIKNRWILRLIFFSFTKVDIATKGGNVYTLFQQDQKYIKHLGISQRGADCYVKFASDSHKWTCYRLSLLACIDVQAPMELLVGSKRCAVGKLDVTKEYVRVIQGSNASPWIA